MFLLALPLLLLVVLLSSSVLLCFRWGCLLLAAGCCWVVVGYCRYSFHYQQGQSPLATRNQCFLYIDPHLPAAAWYATKPQHQKSKHVYLPSTKKRLENTCLACLSPCSTGLGNLPKWCLTKKEIGTYMSKPFKLGPIVIPVYLFVVFLSGLVKFG